MATIITNMNWKATPDYNPKNGTAKEPDENGIVQFEEGTVARTDNVEIFFTDKQLRFTEQMQSDLEALKASHRLVATVEPGYESIPKEEMWLESYATTAYRSDGSSFSVDYYYNRYEGKGYDSDYMSAYAAEANGEGDKGSYYYQLNLKSDIVSYFSTSASLYNDKIAIETGIDALIVEIKQNIADGKADPTKDLQTKVTINGVEWNFADFIDTVEIMNKGFDELDHRVTMNYEDYAKMGISSVYVNDWASKNLSKEQAAAVAKAVNEWIYGYVERQEEHLEENADTWRNVYNHPEKAEYYAYGGWVSASNVEHREAIKELFSSADFNSSSGIANIMQKYQEMMKPVYLAYGSTQSKLSSYLNNTVNHLYSYIANLFGTQCAARILDTSV